jgi:hypothetical protein
MGALVMPSTRGACIPTWGSGRHEKQIANERFAMSAEELLYRLTLIGRATIADDMQLDQTGQPTIAFASATPAQMHALQECSVDDIETKRDRGKRTKIKLTDRISALKLIGHQHRMFKSEATVNGGTQIPVVLSPAQPIAWRLSQDGVRSSAHDEHAIRRTA